MYVPSKIEIEIRKRIRLLIAAYAYEYLAESWLSDYEFDKLAYSIDPTITTGHDVMDKFFKEEFHPATGSWIYDLPREEKDKLKILVKMLIK
jgi:hypothetical protein